MFDRRLLRPIFLTFMVSLSMGGCSGMQPTPMMPTYPARIGGAGGVTPEQDAFCRQQAHQAAQETKDANVAKEIGSTVVGAIAGAAIGNALEPGRPHGPGPGGPGMPPPGPGGPRGPSGPHYGTAGGIAGAAVGAAVSQRMIQDPQQVYDIRYNNCIAAYAR